MAKFKTIRDCYFRSRFYKQGEVANFPDGSEVPHHFAAIDSKEAKAVDAKEAQKASEADAEPKTMHDAAKSKSKVAKPSTAEKVE